jgi:hypothetical protein
LGIQEEYQYIGDSLHNKAKIEEGGIVYSATVSNHKGNLNFHLDVIIVQLAKDAF